jgi:hypothetical protein
MQHNPASARPYRAARAVVPAVLLLAVAGAVAHAGEGAPAQYGLPPGVDWEFNFDATFGVFGFGNSLYTDPKPDDPSGDLGANWSEGSIKPAIGGTYSAADTSQFYGRVSAVGEGTYGASPSLVGGDSTSFDVEDLYLGWRSGSSLGGLGENALDFTVGRTQYKLGHGLILYDGSAEGGSRGGYWTNARKAFEFAAIGRFKPGKHALEAFYLDKDELPESDSGTKLWGANYEYAFSETSTLGATYLKFSADDELAPQRDGLDVYDLRVFLAPVTILKGLSFEAEYVKEDNGADLDSVAWNALVGYQFTSAWEPKLSYRYAFFEGDDPATEGNESFDGLLTGFYDWGTWWQGEIAGEYFVSNSNLISHQVRVHTKPAEAISTGLIFFDFSLDQPAALGPAVTSDDVGQELDWYMDWSVNDHLIVSLVAATADPGKAIEQNSGRTDSFTLGMIFVAYSF